MQSRLSAFVIWALVAGTAVFWGMRLFVRGAEAPAYAVPVGEAATALRGDLARLLGAAPVTAAVVVAAPEVASRFKLVGVMAPRAGGAAQREGQGLALITVDGKPAKPFGVGARIDEGLVLQSVGMRSASIGPAQGMVLVTLDLPPPTPAARGSLPPPGALAEPDIDAPPVRNVPRPVQGLPNRRLPGQAMHPQELGAPPPDQPQPPQQ